MTKTEIAELKKKTDNYLLINIGYEKAVVLPYEDGIAFMNSLINAEVYSNPYSEEPTIIPISSDAITTKVLSGHAYLESKAKGILMAKVEP